MYVLDLFSGIGGFSLGLERTGGFRTTAFCEIDPYCRKVLAKHWPGITIHDDIRRLDGTQYAGAVDVVCGGFPCQDLSVAGNQAGITGKRSGLWSELHRIVSEIRPKYVIVENVPNLLAGERGTWFGRVLGDLAEIGYDAEWHCISASHVGLPQLRDRVWIVAYPHERPLRPWGFRRVQESENVDWKGLVLPSRSRTDYGIPNWLDRVGSCGNAVVPRIPELIGRTILAYEKELGMAA